MTTGIILINKPTGVTSRFVVDKVGKNLGIKRIGHTGTLDPLATGVLIVCLNSATKLVNFLNARDKEYSVGMKLGTLTDTLDITGEVIDTKEVDVNEQRIIDVISSYQKKYQQQVPLYSAVKVNGKKCYEYARNNIEIDLPVKEIEIKKITNIKVEATNITFDTIVSKGTYIRSLVRDIGQDLNTYGVMTSLVRTRQGNYGIDQSDNIDGPYHVITLDELFNEYPIVNIFDDNIVDNGIQLLNENQDDYVRIFKNDECVAIYQANKKDATLLKPLIVINNT